MFLADLTTREKELFLELCIYAAEVNGRVEDEEKDLLQAYCDEMDIRQPKNLKVRPIEEILSCLDEKSNDKSKRIILTETLGMLYADNLCDKKESEFALNMAKAIHIDENTTLALVRKVEEYRKLVEDLYDIILG